MRLTGLFWLFISVKRIITVEYLHATDLYLIDDLQQFYDQLLGGYTNSCKSDLLPEYLKSTKQ